MRTLYSRAAALVALFVLSSIPAIATLPEPPCTSSDSAAGTILITPAGTGPTLASKGLTVSVEVKDGGCNPIAGYPAQDIYVDDIGTGDITLCPGGIIADFSTDASGKTTISGAIQGGGWTQSGLQVYVAGIPMGDILPIDVVSPDNNGDLRVDLVDVSNFAADFMDGVYSFRSDLAPDGTENLADVGELATRLGEVCP